MLMWMTCQGKMIVLRQWWCGGHTSKVTIIRISLRLVSSRERLFSEKLYNEKCGPIRTVFTSDVSADYTSIISAVDVCHCWVQRGVRGQCSVYVHWTKDFPHLKVKGVDGSESWIGPACISSRTAFDLSLVYCRPGNNAQQKWGSA